jgi:flagellar biosynthetic protein FlhB
MAEHEHQERTEQATPRKRQKAREKGQVVRSRDLTSIISTGGIILVMYLSGRHLADNAIHLTSGLLSLNYGTNAFDVLKIASLKGIMVLMPFLAVAFGLAVTTGFLQGGMIFKPLELKLEAVNPINGIKKMFSMNGFTEFLKSLIKFSVGAFLFYAVIKNNLYTLPSLMDMGVRGIAVTTSILLLKVITYGVLCFLAVAIIDYFFQKWQFERSIRMSMKELKEEHKESEGDPYIKSKIKSIQKEMAMRRMMQEVPKATVVITNPVHLAVALKYEGKDMTAPKIVAKGADVLAEKIKEIARRKGVPIVEDKPLARMLYKVEIGSYIPDDLYRAVAKILAYVYKMRGAA